MLALLTGPLAGWAQWPDDLPLPDLWVRGDSSLELSGVRVVTWPDISGNDNHLTQGVNQFRPNVENEAMPGHTVVRFNGTNNRLLFDEMDEIRTVVWVAQRPENVGTIRRPLLGHNETLDFYRGPNQNLWDETFSNEAVVNGSTRMGFEEVDGTATPLPLGWQIISVVTTGNTEANQLGQDRATNNFWMGDFAEVILFNVPLTNEQVIEVENYLTDYYTSPLDLGEDIVVTSGFCPTSLAIDEGFVDILWSTGATTPEIEVNNSGTFWVQAKDVFGRTVSDTIQVTYPGSTNFESELVLCEGDSFLINLELDETFYDIVWSDGQLGSEATFDQSGSYSATITDTDECTLITEAVDVLIDAFASEASLGEDLDLCAGNSIALNYDGELQSILWMDEFDDTELIIESSGEYFVEAINENGCILQDTVTVTVVGEAPEVVINQPGVFCLNTEGALQASIAADSPISSIDWILPGDFQASEQNIEWVPQQTGSADIGVTVATEAGCSTSVTTQTIVFPLPEGQITVGTACTLVDFNLNATLSIESGTIASVDWEFEGQSYFGTPSVVVPQSPGFQEVTLILTSNMGCEASFQQLVEVRQSPIVQGAADNTCVGELTAFSTEVVDPGLGGIVGWQWFFGDNTTSTQQNPMHLYPTQGSYDAVVQAIAATGCVGLDTVEVTVIPLPSADFAVSNACLEVPYAVENLSSSQDPIDGFIWTVNGQEVYTGENPELLFTETGFNAVELYVETDQGCSNTVSKMIPVFELPLAGFSANPPIGLPPLEVSFENSSQGGVEFIWEQEGQFFSDEENPQFTFTEEGTYTVELQVVNEFGCSKSAQGQVDVTEPIVDLVIDAIDLQAAPNGYQISALVVNVGNVTADAIDMAASHGNGTTITERLETPLLPGASLLYTWSAQLQPTEAAYPYFCVTAEPVSTLGTERTPENNRRCKEEAAGFELTPVFPNPVPTGGNLLIRAILPQAEKVIIRLIDQRGAVALQTEELSLRQGFNELSVSTERLNAGQYTLTFIGERNQASQQVQVARQ